jgi:ATPase family associated with various cellular activities (AAA)
MRSVPCATSSISRPYISPRFRRALLLHLFKNFAPPILPSSPLILGISGPSGEGKTFHCAHILEELGTYVVLISGGQLEHSDAGKPAELIRESYLNASAEFTRDRSLSSAALVINDVDTGVGDWGDQVQYTVNRQTVFGELMHLCDYPTQVGGHKSNRIPIILTGNDFTRLYGPLVRPGRMGAFAWVPDHAERKSIVERIFPEISGQEIDDLMRRHPQQPIAFFSHLRSQLIDDILWDQLSIVEPRIALRSLRDGMLPDLSVQVSYSAVFQLASELAESHEFANYLGS